MSKHVRLSAILSGHHNIAIENLTSRYPYSYLVSYAVQTLQVTK